MPQAIKNLRSLILDTVLIITFALLLFLLYFTVVEVQLVGYMLKFSLLSLHKAGIPRFIYA